MEETLPKIARGQQEIKEVLEENSDYLNDIKDTLTAQFDFTKDLADKEQLNYQNDLLREEENRRENQNDTDYMNNNGRSGGLFSNLAKNIPNLQSKLSLSKILPRAFATGLLLNYADEINSFLSGELTEIFKNVDLPEEVEEKITQIAGDYGAQLAAAGAVGSIFGFKGALVATIATFIWKEFGLERLLSDEGRDEFKENIGQEIRDKFGNLSGTAVGIGAGGLFMSLGFKKLGLGAIVGGLVWDWLGLDRLGTKEGEDAIVQDIKDGINDGWKKISNLDIELDFQNVARGATLALSAVIIKVLKNGILGIFNTAKNTVSSLFGRTPTETPEEITLREQRNQRLADATKSQRFDAAQDALKGVSDADLDKYGYKRNATGSVVNKSGKIASADDLQTLTQRTGRIGQYSSALGNRLGVSSASGSKSIKVLTKFLKFATTIPGLATIINVGLWTSIIMDDTMSEEQKKQALAQSVGETALILLGGIIGSFFGSPLIGGLIGLAAGYFLGDNIARGFIDFLWVDSDDFMSWSNTNLKADVSKADIEATLQVRKQQGLDITEMSAAEAGLRLEYDTYKYKNPQDNISFQHYRQMRNSASPQARRYNEFSGGFKNTFTSGMLIDETEQGGRVGPSDINLDPGRFYGPQPTLDQLYPTITKPGEIPANTPNRFVQLEKGIGKGEFTELAKQLITFGSKASSVSPVIVSGNNFDSSQNVVVGGRSGSGGPLPAGSARNNDPSYGRQVVMG